MRKLCRCKCGEPAAPGKRFARYHQLLNGRPAIWNGAKYVLRHRHLMEQELGRPLAPGEVVHHLDEDPFNNDISNLVLCPSDREHKTTYHRKASAEFACEICGKIHHGPKRRKHHFCSRECWRKWSPPGAPRKHGRAVKKAHACRQCGKEFIDKRVGANSYCSRDCYYASLCGQSKATGANLRLIPFQGALVSLTELSRLTHISMKTLHSRIVAYGWSVEDAISRPVRDRGR